MSLLRRHLQSTFVAVIGSLATALQADAQTPVPTVAAASDLKFALEELAARFERATGHKLRLVFGSSGHFKTQILQGAPFHPRSSTAGMAGMRRAVDARRHGGSTCAGLQASDCSRWRRTGPFDPKRHSDRRDSGL